MIFKPRGVKRPLFPWLLTGLIPFRGASERADAESIATQVPNVSADEEEIQRGFAWRNHRVAEIPGGMIGQRARGHLL